MAKTKENPLAKVKVAGRAKAKGALRAKAKRGAPVKTEAKFGNLQRDKQQNAPASTATTAARFETVAAEASDNSKKSVENGFAFFEELLGARSFECAHIGPEYAKTSHVNFVVNLTKIGELCATFAKDALGERPYIA
jgi:hypothetical protein